MARVLCKSDASLDLFEDKNKIYGDYLNDAAIETGELMSGTAEVDDSVKQLETVGDVTLRSHARVVR